MLRCFRACVRAMFCRSAKNIAGGSSTGGMHMRPWISRLHSLRQKFRKSGRSFGVMPDFWSSSPILTWIRQGMDLFCAFISSPSFFASFSRSTLWIMSNRASASLTLLV